MNKATKTCKLCLQESALSKSHIIPEFMYRSLYDEKHRFLELSTIKGKKNIFLQKGIRERLLCSNCETNLSKHEHYASSVFQRKKKLSTSSEGNLIYIEGLEYSTLKLFALSILWRAGVSTLPIFKQVQLGPHEEQLRQMVLRNNPGAQDTYGFLISPILHQGKQLFDVIVEPSWSRLQGHFVCRFIFGGLSWIFVVSNHKPPTSIRPAYLSEKGALIMCKSSLSEMPFLKKTAIELQKHGKLG